MCITWKCWLGSRLPRPRLRCPLLRCIYIPRLLCLGGAPLRAPRPGHQRLLGCHLHPLRPPLLDCPTRRPGVPRCGSLMGRLGKSGLRRGAVFSRVRPLALEAVVGTHAGRPCARFVLGATTIHPVRRASGGGRHCVSVGLCICGNRFIVCRSRICSIVEARTGVKSNVSPSIITLDRDLLAGRGGTRFRGVL